MEGSRGASGDHRNKWVWTGLGGSNATQLLNRKAWVLFYLGRRYRTKCYTNSTGVPNQLIRTFSQSDMCILKCLNETGPNRSPFNWEVESIIYVSTTPLQFK
uniref:Uncharacterized protein n=1 Tax=Picea glauca TaxID=3330 RepID=A0A101LZY5_PICGL|nr:hypothetical protein ABT39_MTgene4514 [Picea glauca]QHR87393.1 hypothetical protein Q903MT_gene1403 [Picea sitchensis]